MLDFPGPGGLTAGQVFTAAGKSWQWDGAKWAAAAGSPGASITVSDTAPASPSPGALWWNSAVGVGQLFVRYADVDSSQWVIANQGVPGPPGLYQSGPGLTINSGTSPPTIDVATPYAPLDSPDLTGTPRAPNAPAATNTTQLATTAFVKAQNYVTGGPYLPTAGGTLSGNLTINGTTNTALSLTAPSGAGSFWSSMQLIGGRNWVHIINPDGSFNIFDNTAPANRISISTSGACQNTSGTWSAFSDATLKQQETVVDYTAGLAQVIQLRPVTFGWAATNLGPEQNWGLIAQEVEPVMPELVGEAPIFTGREVEGEVPPMVKTVDYGRIIFSVINALREISERLDAIEARLG